MIFVYNFKPLFISTTTINNPFSIQQQITKLQAEQILYSTKLTNRFNGNLSLSYDYFRQSI